MDVTDKDAASARTRAIIEAQVKAFYILAERLGSPEDEKDRGQQRQPGTLQAAWVRALG